MTAQQIIQQRLVNQQLSHHHFHTVADVVACLGAMQAQDYAMAKWAIGTRLPQATDEAVEQALNNREIIRTHLLRPTWHFAAATDVRWLLALTSPQILKAMASRSRELELSDVIFNKSNTLIAKTLQKEKQLTRTELMQLLHKAGIPADTMRGSHLMLHAELSGIVCNGSKRGKEFTYALLDDIVPAAAPVEREEALARLALRYFTAHGPATLPDFTWWSGLSVTDARKALESAKKQLISAPFNNNTYWWADTKKEIKRKASSLYLLPAFDEWIIGYKDRSLMVDNAFIKHTISSNGIFKPVILENGKVTGTWKRTLHKQTMLIDPIYYSKPGSTQQKAVTRAAAGYATFYGASFFQVNEPGYPVAG